MKIWLFKLGEQIPTDAGSPKLSRTALVADELSRRGHDVTWWMSTFDHLEKHQRAKEDVCLEIRPNYRVRMLHTPGYERNVSLARYLDYSQFARRLKREIAKSQPPDLIFAAYPAIDACDVFRKYAQEHGVQFVVDVRDMWPDIFRDYLPSFARWTYPILFGRETLKARHIFSDATAVLAVHEEFVSWALRQGQRPRDPIHRDFRLGYAAHAPLNPEELERGRLFWRERGVTPDSFVICFFGVMSKKNNFEPVAAGMQQLGVKFPEVRLVLCGSGDESEATSRLFAGLDNVITTGWIDRPKIAALMEVSKAGVAPYHNRIDFLNQVPTKIIEYLAGGLPVLTSLSGASRELLENRGCGFWYSDAAGFEKCVSELVASAGLLESARRKAGDLFYERFQAKRIYSELCDHLETIGGMKTKAVAAKASSGRELEAISER